MAEYIEKETLVNSFRSCGASKDLIDSIVYRINLQKAADVAPVRHGRWIIKKTSAGAYYTLCSHCNSSVKYNDEYGTAIMNLKGANYCPNCGAKMDEVSE